MSIEVSEKEITPKNPLSKNEKKLLAYVDKNEQLVVDLLQKLVRLESLNFSEFRFHKIDEIFNFTQDFMKNEGFNTELFKAPFLSGKKNEYYYNLISFIDGEKKGKTLQFNGHLDIVPFNPDNWDDDTPPLDGVIKDGKLYGRGSIDMKAGIACQMIAMKLLKESGLKFNGKLQLWLTPDEETHGTYGSIYMTKNHFKVINADATIVGEPSISKPMSSPSIGLGEKGPNWVKFTFHGVAGHGSWPKLKSNAINKATRFMYKANKKLKIPKRKPPITKFQHLKYMLRRVSFSDLKKVRSFTGEKSPLDKDKKDPGILYRTTFSFTEINAGVKTNVIPDTCELSADFRAMPGLSTQELFDSIAKFCSKLKYRIELPEGYKNLQHNNPRFSEEPVDITLSIITIGEGSATDPNTEFGKTVQNSFEAVYETSPIFHFNTGFSDGGNMREAGMKDIFVFGPGGRGAHNANEYTDLDTLKDVTKLYLLIAYRYLNS